MVRQRLSLLQNVRMASEENMGLTTWKGDKVRKQDVTVSKNYLTEKEMKSLNRIVTMYLDYAEDQAERNQPMYMNDWTRKLTAFLKFNERDILENAGKMEKIVADQLSITEYEKFNQHRLQEYKVGDFEDYIRKKGLNNQ